MSDVQAGSSVTIVSDILINGVLAFAAGERVTIESITPNANDPQFRYVVLSSRTAKRYQLRDGDITMAPAPEAPLPPVGAQPPAQGVFVPGPVPPPARAARGSRPPKKAAKPVKAARGTGGGHGLKVLTVVLVVLLVAAAGGAVYLYLKSNDTKKKDDAQIESLEKQVSDLQKQVKRLTVSSAPAGSSAPGQSTQPQPPTSDQQTLTIIATAQYPGREVGEIKIVGDWARVGLKGSSNPPVQGEQVYYQKINGVWTYVAAGTGLTPADIPGSPPALFE